ncbi:MAG: HAD-IC family P-type ATPase [Clostridiales bacterium]|jgi:Cd2+/Zn2+-exporting ATPase|nr:HAD-IC family P-type ATPase [Clostridiales bacterium]
MEAVVRHEYELDGLCCPNCSKKIEDRVKKLAGLSKVTLNYAFKKLTLFAGNQWSCAELCREINGIIDNIEDGIVLKPLCSCMAADGAAAVTTDGTTDTAATVSRAAATGTGAAGATAAGAAAATAAGVGAAADSRADGAAAGAGAGAGASGAVATGTLCAGAATGAAGTGAAVQARALPRWLQAPAGKRAAALKLAAGTAFLIAATLIGELAPAPQPLLPALALYIASYLLIGEQVLRSAFKNIKNGYIFDENFLMVVATAGAFAIGQYPEAVAVMIFYRVGEYFQDRAVGKSRASISQLLNIKPAFANLVTSAGLRQVAPEDVAVGQSIAVRPGERVPLDGSVLEGESYLDVKELTGEPVPVYVESGSAVLSGSINTSGLLTIRAEKAYKDSTVSKILYMVEDAAAKKAPAEKFITKFASVYTPAVMAVAALISIVPPIAIAMAAAGGGAPDFRPWVYRGLIFLVVSCPCALVLSVPLSYFSGIGAASARGVLVKGGNYLDALGKVDTVVFDKTGTLTKGVFSVTAVMPAAAGAAGGVAANGGAPSGAADGMASGMASGETAIAGAANGEAAAAGGDLPGAGRIGGEGDGEGAANELLRLAAHAEMFSTHPIAKSVVAEYVRRAGKGAGEGSGASAGKGAVDGSGASAGKGTGDSSGAGAPLDESAVRLCEEVAGHGVRAQVGGRRVAVGNARLMELEGIGAGALPAAGDTALFVAADGAYMGCIAVEDAIKSDAYGIERLLRGVGVKNVLMLTGDSERTARAVGERIGISNVCAGLLPHQKVEAIERLAASKAAGAKIAFAGDGINDAPVLARADVGFAMGGVGSDAAIEAADVVIMNDEPSKIAEAIRISHGTKRVVMQNIAFAVGVKAIVLALAAAGLANMWVAVFADVGVAVLAVLNSIRISRMARAGTEAGAAAGARA